MKHLKDSQSNIKRDYVIAELSEAGIREIHGKSLNQLDYSTLRRFLAINRATNQ